MQISDKLKIKIIEREWIKNIPEPHDGSIIVIFSSLSRKISFAVT